MIFAAAEWVTSCMMPDYIQEHNIVYTWYRPTQSLTYACGTSRQPRASTPAISGARQFKRYISVYLNHEFESSPCRTVRR